jgi:ParB/RepB/Spo0J family partition protein
VSNQIHEIPLDQIRPAPWNPPSRLDPAAVKDLAASIRREGQKSAALVRPVKETCPDCTGGGYTYNPDSGEICFRCKGSGQVDFYELVFGHRRYAAKKLLSEKVDAAHAVLRCEIEEMDEARAMILSGIENLQREGFTDYEEAEFIRSCSEQYGESAVKVLAEKLSVRQPYIRKRLEILKLPEVVLVLWQAGTWHVGHMEQFLRLGDRVEEYMRLQSGLFGSRAKDLTVRDLARNIDQMALPLKKACFDKADCKACPKNTDCQRKLFDTCNEKGQCQDQECFQAKQQAWLDVNWATCKENRYGTQQAIIGDYNTETTGAFPDWGDPKPGEKCQSCGHFTTILRLANGLEVFNHKWVCMGEEECFAAIVKEGKRGRDKNGKALPKDPDAPRVPWHGEFYRQEFYHQEIPSLMQALDPDDPRHLQLTLATVLYSAKFLHDWFWQETGRAVHQLPDYYTFAVSFSSLLLTVRELDPGRIKVLLAEALVRVALKKDRGYETVFNDKDRQALAEFLGIDWKNFVVTEEYLKKKTKAEIIKLIGSELWLLPDPEFQRYLKGRGLPNDIEKLAKEKKPFLVNLILNCGVDLHGRLPKEIADRSDLLKEEAVVAVESGRTGEFADCYNCGEMHPEDGLIEFNDQLLCPNCAHEAGYQPAQEEPDGSDPEETVSD